MTPIFSVSHLSQSTQVSDNQLSHWQRTDATLPDAQAQGQQTESNRQLTHKKKRAGKQRIVRNIPTLPLSLIVPDGHEAAFFSSLADGLLSRTMHSNQN